MPSELTGAQTPTEVLRNLPSSGVRWDEAIEVGVDVTLLLHNLRLGPRERLVQAQQQQRFADAVRQRVVPARVRAQLDRERLWEKIDALGGVDPAWPDVLGER